MNFQNALLKETSHRGESRAIILNKAGITQFYIIAGEINGQK
jgi:hypothetical protein